MNGAVPLLRIAEAATRAPCSRIPHLQVHIRARKLHIRASIRPRPTRPVAKPVPSEVRHSSSSIGVLDLLFPEKHAEGRESYQRAPSSSYQDLSASTSHPPAAHDAARNEIISGTQIIEEGQPDQVLHALLFTPDGDHLIRTGSDETFSRAFCCLTPEHFLEPYKPQYRFLPASLHLTPLHRVVRSLEDRFQIFRACLESFANKRKQAGHALTLDVYRHFLRCAESMGDEQLARLVLDKWMVADGVEPDLDCYNSLLGACAWSGQFEVAQKTHNRRDPRNIHLRSGESTRIKLQHYSALRRSRPERTQSANLRQYALKVFQALGRREFVGNEKTFTNLMMALGQAGDLNGVHSILRSVWNINLDLLNRYDEEEVESPTFYEESSPLRPTQRLLMIVIQVFGNNNDLSAASLLVDYLARNYNVAITEEIWTELFSMTYQLSNHRFSKRPPLQHPGLVPHGSLTRLHQTMTDEPHNQDPNVFMQVLLARHASQYFQYDDAIEHLKEVQRLVDVEATKLSPLYDEMLREVRRSQEEDQPPFFSKDFFSKRQEFLQQSLVSEAARQQFSIAVRRLLRENPPPVDQPTERREHSMRRIPKIIQEFESNLPNRLKYLVASGFVTLENSSLHRNEAIEQADGHFAERVGDLRQALDLNYQDVMAERLRRLLQELDHPPNFCELCAEDGHTRASCPNKAQHLAGWLQPKASTTAVRVDSPKSSAADVQYARAEVYLPIAIELEHVVAPGQHLNEENLQDRKSKTGYYDYYAGQTPDPTKDRGETQPRFMAQGRQHATMGSDDV